MAEAFLSLDSGERADILRTVAARSGRAAIILEKDIWVCWVLQAVKRHSKLTPWRHRKLTPEETAYVDGSAGSEGLSADGGFRAGRWCWSRRTGVPSRDGTAWLGRTVWSTTTQWKGRSVERQPECRGRLVPGDDQLPGLQADYDAMRAAAIVGDDAPVFDALIEEIRTLEANVNGSG